MNTKRTALGVALALSLFTAGAGAENGVRSRADSATADSRAAAEHPADNTVVSAVPARVPIRSALPSTADEIRLTDLKIYPSF